MTATFATVIPKTVKIDRNFAGWIGADENIERLTGADAGVGAISFDSLRPEVIALYITQLPIRGTRSVVLINNEFALGRRARNEVRRDDQPCERGGADTF